MRTFSNSNSPPTQTTPPCHGADSRPCHRGWRADGAPNKQQADWVGAPASASAPATVPVPVPVPTPASAPATALLLLLLLLLDTCMVCQAVTQVPWYQRVKETP